MTATIGLVVHAAGRIVDGVYVWVQWEEFEDLVVVSHKITACFPVCSICSLFSGE